MTRQASVELHPEESTAGKMPRMPELHSPLGFLILAGTGFVAGTLNVLAGGGSFLTLPVLIFLGLPPGVANGTNRVGILLQHVSAVWSFRRLGISEPQTLLWAALPATLGGACGAILAVRISDQDFQQTLAFLMVAISLASFWKPARDESRRISSAWLALGFFVVGIYGGFVQAGVGFLILAVTSLAGFDLVRGNAVKVLAILCLTGLSLAIFVWQNRVDWIPGSFLAVGTIGGGALGARLTVLKGDRWIRRLVTLLVLLFAVRLWISA